MRWDTSALMHRDGVMWIGYCGRAGRHSSAHVCMQDIAAPILAVGIVTYELNSTPCEKQMHPRAALLSAFTFNSNKTKSQSIHESRVPLECSQCHVIYIMDVMSRSINSHPTQNSSNEGHMTRTNIHASSHHNIIERSCKNKQPARKESRCNPASSTRVLVADGHACRNLLEPRQCVFRRTSRTSLLRKTKKPRERNGGHGDGGRGTGDQEWG